VDLEGASESESHEDEFEKLCHICTSRDGCLVSVSSNTLKVVCGFVSKSVLASANQIVPAYCLQGQGICMSLTVSCVCGTTNS